MSIHENNGIEKPTENWTKYPNCILDNLDMYSGVEIKILSLMVRKNIGYTNPNKMFSLTYLMKKLNIKSKPTVSNAIQNLLNIGSIVRIGKKNNTYIYDIKWVKTVRLSNRFNNQTDIGLINKPLSVQKLNPLKENIVKENIVKENSEPLSAIKFWNKLTNQKIDSSAGNIRMTKACINRYSLEQLKAAMENLNKDKWSIEKKMINLSRLISTKNNMRENNMLKFGKIVVPEPVKKPKIETITRAEYEKRERFAERLMKDMI